MQVLVLDADMVPALTIARSLARRGCEVDTGGHTDKPITGFSRAIRSLYTYPDPLSDTESFVQWLGRHTRDVNYDLIIPVTERTLTPLSRHSADFSHVRIAMPELECLELVLDKSKTLALAAELGVPIPGSISVNNLDELAEQKEALRYPVVLKPARSIGSREGGSSHLQVSYAFDTVGLVTGCSHALRFGSVVMQEYFAGDGVGVELIARHGEVIFAFQHRRLHEVPLTGGGSSLRVSEALDPILLDASARLVRALRWNGVAMVEFKVDRNTGEFRLMEINGRFWGSLPLADAAGADFPSLLLDLELGLEQRPPPRSYREGIYCRLLSRDLVWYEAVLRGNVDQRIVDLPTRWQVFKGLALFLHPRHRFDVQSLRDPMPGLVDFGRILASYYRRFSGLVGERKFMRRQRRAWRRGEVAAALKSATTVLFLCYGNINRSALADAMLRGYAEDVGVVVRSAGFHPHEDRSTDPVMTEIALDFGVDMGSQRSTTVDAALLQSSDVVFVMEKKHHDRVLAIAPTLAGRVYLLGAHPTDTATPAEIDDPFGMPREAYLRCYQRIAEAIDHIKAVIAVRSEV